MMLEFKNVSFRYAVDEFPMMENLSFSVEEGDFVSIIGASGCGKSTIFRLINGLEQLQKGEILVNGRPIREQKQYSAFMPQKDLLFPWRTIEKNICLPMELAGVPAAEQAKRCREVLAQVGLLEYMKKYPKDLSGGMKQRVIIAIALACSPQLLIADEPTTALDVTIQDQILQLKRELKQKKDTSMIMITNDLGIVAETCDRVAVMYAGKIIEEGNLDEVFNHTLHPYTEGLFNSLPNIKNRRSKLEPIRGLMPDPTNLPRGCAFAPRCNYATDACRERRPELVSFGGTHKAACLAYENPDFHIERGKKNG